MINETTMTGKLKPPSIAVNAPIANKSESPGRNGVTIKPVSAKMIANSKT